MFGNQITTFVGPTFYLNSFTLAYVLLIMRATVRNSLLVFLYALTGVLYLVVRLPGILLGCFSCVPAYLGLFI